MFGFFKKKRPQSGQGKLGPGGPVISALLLEGESFPVDDFLKEIVKTKIAGQSAKDVENNGEGIFSFSVGDELFVLAVMPAPYPASDLEGPIATSLIWPPKPPIDIVKGHRSHLLITMTGGSGDPVRRRLTLTEVTALAAKQEGVMAVFWPEAAHLVFPPVFIDMAKSIDSPEAPPLYLWVDIRVFKNPDGTTGLFTTGLSPLGHMEIEIPSIDMNPGELREWLINIMYYVLESGPVLKHGETIGMTAEQKIRISHVPSGFGRQGKVIRLEP